MGRGDINERVDPTAKDLIIIQARTASSRLPSKVLMDVLRETRWMKITCVVTTRLREFLKYFIDNIRVY